MSRFFSQPFFPLLNDLDFDGDDPDVDLAKAQFEALFEFAEEVPVIRRRLYIHHQPQALVLKPLACVRPNALEQFGRSDHGPEFRNQFFLSLKEFLLLDGRAVVIPNGQENLVASA